MQDLKITLVQIDQVWEDKEENFKRYEKLLQNVDTDLIVLPEMFQTGFSMNALKLSEKWQDSPSLNWLKIISEEKNAAIYTSFIVEDDRKYYNRGIFVKPNGTVEYYDKRKSFGLAGENNVFTPGKKSKIVEYRGWKIQLQICYDLRFPEIVRNEMDGSENPFYDLILYVANWPEKRITHWDALLTARAIENQSYVVGVNRVGEDGHQHIYNGHSRLIDSLGEIQTLDNHKEMAQTFQISRKILLDNRKKLPFLRDR